MLYGEVVSASSYVPEKTGYTFLGWYYTDSSGCESEYSFTTAVTSDFTLKAKYSLNSYRIYFDKNGAVSNYGSMDPIKCFWGSEYTLAKNTFTSVGATFLGWSTSSFSEEAEFKDCATVKNLSSKNGDSVTLYAVWSDNPCHLISYENLNGATHSNPRKFLEKQEISLSDASLEGYDFCGWYLTEDFSGEKVTGWFAGEKTSDITLYAKWTPVNVTVEFLSNSTSYKTYPVQAGSRIDAIKIDDFKSAVGANAGWTFSGFYTEEYAKGIQYINSSGENIVAFTKDLTLYAAWIYSISYDVSTNIESTTVFANSNATSYTGETDYELKSLSVKTGYKFLGWLDENEKEATKISAGTYGARTFTAIGIEPIEYTITYNKNGGDWDTGDDDSTEDDYIPLETYTIECDTISLPSGLDIKKDGCTFSGWYTSEDFSGGALTLIESGSHENITLYAKWE